MYRPILTLALSCYKQQNKRYKEYYLGRINIRADNCSILTRTSTKISLLSVIKKISSPIEINVFEHLFGILFLSNKSQIPVSITED